MRRFFPVVWLSLVLASGAVARAQEPAKKADTQAEAEKEKKDAKAAPKPAGAPGKPGSVQPPKPVHPPNPSAHLPDTSLSHTKPSTPSSKPDSHPSGTRKKTTPKISEAEKTEEKDEHHGEVGCDKYKDAAAHQKCEQEEEAKRVKAAKP